MSPPIVGPRAIYEKSSDSEESFKIEPTFHKNRKIICNYKVQASPQANTFAISGQAETKQVSEMLPSIVNQLGPEGFASLRKLAMEKVPAAKDDDVPELEGDFEEASKQEEEQSKAVSYKN